MPQITNIVVKKADNTTDTTYTAVTGSAGDDSPAVWRNSSVGTKVNQRPEFKMSASATTNGRRSIKTNFVYPITETTPAGDVITDYVTIVVTAKITSNATEAAIAEAVTQGLNLNAASLTKDSFKAGYAPRS